MAKFHLTDSMLIIIPEGSRRFLTLTPVLEIPLETIEKVEVVDPETAWSRRPNVWRKIYGCNASWIYFGGAFRTSIVDFDSDPYVLVNFGLAFYDLKRGETALEIFLNGQKFQKLVIGFSSYQEARDTSEKLQKKLEESDRRDRMSIVPILIEDGVFKEKDLWSL